MPTLNPSMRLAIPLLGVQADRHPRMIDPAGLYEAENMLVRDGRFVGRPGLRAFGSTVSERPMGFAQYDHEDEHRRIVLGTTRRWMRWDKVSSTWIEVSSSSNRLNGVNSSLVVFRVFQDDTGVCYLLGANGVDLAKKWDGESAHTYEDIGGQTRIPRCIAVAADHLIMAGFQDGDQDVEWSNNMDFDTGYSSPGHGKRLGETPGAIVALQELGAYNVAAYKHDAVYLAFAQADEITFHWTPKFLGVPGPCSPLCVVPLPNGSHAVLATDGGVYLFTGSNYENAGTHIQRFVADNWYYQNAEQAWGYYDEAHRELWFIYPHKATMQLSHAICLSLPSWSLYPMRWTSLRMSAGGHFSTANELLFGEVTLPWASSPLTFDETSQERLGTFLGETTGQVCEVGDNMDLTEAIGMLWEYGLTDAGSLQTWKTVVAGDHAFNRTPTTQPVSFKVGYSRNGEARTLSDARPLDLVNTGPLRTGHRVSGRLLSARYELQATQEIDYLGAEIGYAVRGLR